MGDQYPNKGKVEGTVLKLTDWDVCLGRGVSFRHLPGNKIFQGLCVTGNK